MSDFLVSLTLGQANAFAVALTLITSHGIAHVVVAEIRSHRKNTTPRKVAR